MFLVNKCDEYFETYSINKYILTLYLFIIINTYNLINIFGEYFVAITNLKYISNNRIMHGPGVIRLVNKAEDKHDQIHFLLVDKCFFLSIS